MFILAYSLKTPAGLRDHFESHEDRADLDKAYAVLLTRDRLFTASKCLVLESTDYCPPPIQYSNDTLLTTGGTITLVKAAKHSGWLYHDKGKTFYHLYPNLQAFFDTHTPEKAWRHDPSFDNFEEEVIEHWLMTGEDVKGSA